MDKYDPLNAPDPSEWLSIDESERIGLVIDHHRRAGVEVPDEQIHAVVHTIVENQVALGDKVPTGVTLNRLVREGLDRHEAIHAIGGVLVEFMQDMLRDRASAPDIDAGLFQALEKITAAEWLKSFGQVR